MQGQYECRHCGKTFNMSEQRDFHKKYMEKFGTEPQQCYRCNENTNEYDKSTQSNTIEVRYDIPWWMQK